jgi:SpoVK/Ycf46/Vps4 family AAA+-type ATPase
VFIPPPDLDGREAIMKILLKGKPVDNIDYNIIAKSTPFFSGADLNSIIDVSIEKIIEEAIHTGTQKKIETKDLLNAIKERRPSTLEWFNTAKNYATFSNVSGQYDDILKYIKENKL